MNIEENSIETIEKEYRKIDRHWLFVEYRTMLWVVLAATLVEIGMYFVLNALSLVEVSANRYLFKYVLVPLTLNLLILLLIRWSLNNPRLAEDRREAAISLGVALIALVFYSIHSTFYAMNLILPVPIAFTILYGSQKLTTATGLVCIAGKAVLDLFVRWDPNRAVQLEDGAAAADFYMSLALLAVVTVVCRQMSAAERKKNGVSLRIARERQALRAKSMTDELTQVWNRQALRDAFQEMEQNPNRQYLLAMMDMDHFKDLNDTYGHRRGDRYLRELGDTLRGVAETGVMVFRFGGDEFCVLFRDRTREQAEETCRTIQRNFALARVNQEFHSVTISIGVAAFRRGEKPNQLLDRADHALYAAKQDRGSICFLME